MNLENIIFELAVIFAGASILSTLFLFLKQPVILAYIGWGVLAGPGMLKLIENPDVIENISHLGIVLLMFLLGLSLHPTKLIELMKSTSIIATVTSISFALISMVVLLLFKVPLFESFIASLALIFSSTVISLKLCPTTTLHQQHQGQVMTSVLLLQDLIAVVIILLLKGNGHENILIGPLLLIVYLVLLFIVTIVLVKFVIIKLFLKFDIIQEYIFLISLGWCLLGAEAAQLLGLSYEVGAFVAGISLATSPIALVIVENLKPIREFFLILFFFSIGAKFDILSTAEVLLPAVVLGTILCLLKPLIFRKTFRIFKEEDKTAKNLGWRLGQCSEFSLLLSAAAVKSSQISERTSSMVQLCTFVTFIISTYIVVYKFPTPISVSTQRNRD